MNPNSRVTLDRQNTTFCTGLWVVENNTKRSPRHYEKFARKTCRLLSGCNVVLAYEQADTLELFEDEAKKNNINLVAHQVQVEQLPYFHLGEDLLRSCKRMVDQFPNGKPARIWRRREKGEIHYWREYQRSGEEAYKRITSIWLSKPQIVRNFGVTLNPFGTDNFAWIDSSFSRVDLDIFAATTTENDLAHYGSGMRYLGQRLPLSAGFLLGSSQIWSKLVDLMDAEIKASLSDAYAHDDETILSRILHKNPELFHMISQRD